MGRVIELLVDQFIVFDQGDPTSNPQGQSAFDTLVLTDTAKNYKSYHTVSQLLEFGQNADYRRSIYHLSVSDYLPFYHMGGSGPALQQIVQFFFIGQNVYLGDYEIISQTLTITETLIVELAKNAINTLVMADAVTYSVMRTIPVVQTLFIGSGGTGYVLREDTYSIALPTISGPNAPEC